MTCESSHTLAAPLASITATTSQRARSEAASTRAYTAVSASSPRPTARSNQERCAWWRSSLEHIIGESVSATKPETITAPASASANSVNSRPVRPGVKASGA